MQAAVGITISLTGTATIILPSSLKMGSKEKNSLRGIFRF
jgi:hypothetical protein